jgi:hypothetical protein
MTEAEAVKAMRNGDRVRLVNAGKVYRGKLVARYGSGTSFLFQGKTERGETISYLGRPEEFALAQRKR